MASFQNSEYGIGCICALPLEMAALQAMLDEVHEKPAWQYSHDSNNYTLGKIGPHNVAIVCLPAGVYGTTSATKIATQMLSSFPSIKFALMVGIGGGVPSTANDIRLGDVVVSKPKGNSSGVIQYDYGKAVRGELISAGVLDKPPQHLLTAVARLDAEHLTYGSNKVAEYVSDMLRRFPNMTRFASPGSQNDHLYRADYEHVGDGTTCDECDKSHLVDRSARNIDQPQIFYGTIGSGNQVIKDGVKRDKLAKQKEILCFEMEAAGLMDILPCLVIRGICDYADSHKNKIWQEYAAATAAAYAKELLYSLPNRPVSPCFSELWEREGSLRSGPSFKSGASFGSESTLVENLNAQLQAQAQDSTTLPSRTFMITSRLYPKEDISLASFIADRRYPNQDALVVTSANSTPDKVLNISLEEGRDYSITSDKNFSQYVGTQTTKDSSLKKAMSKLFLKPMFQVDGEMQVFAEESRVYTLRQPQALFQRMYEDPDTRKRLQSFCSKSKKVHFITGFRTLVNARFMGKEKRAPQFSRLPPKLAGDPLYQTTGERIYAICYRKVNLRRLNSKDGDGILNSESDWKGFWEEVRGSGEPDEKVAEEISAEISSEDETAGGDNWTYPAEGGNEVWIGLQ
ncbi:hypothetical protein TWF694_011749 [Orbilia ellipsospora]|uniref:Nucleoside phosphorylase domain-containing protein n=1 Tax=Orbilia ellipsospora TaxID=2528407 RepID=A0AAV9X7D0_9PEZI